MCPTAFVPAEVIQENRSQINVGIKLGTSAHSEKAHQMKAAVARAGQSYEQDWSLASPAKLERGMGGGGVGEPTEDALILEFLFFE